MRLKGAVVVITGASSGIGEATAVAFAKRGARLELGARRLDKLNAVAQRCRQAGSPDVNVRLLDVGLRGSARAFIAATLRDHERLDILVNNAGTGWVGRVQEKEPPIGVLQYPATWVASLIVRTARFPRRDAMVAPLRLLHVAEPVLGGLGDHLLGEARRRALKD